MKLKKFITGIVCLGIVGVSMKGYVVGAANGVTMYMGRHFGEFDSGSLDPLHNDRFQAKLQPCGTQFGSHISGADIYVTLKYFKNDSIQTGTKHKEHFPVEGRLISKYMGTKKYEAPSSHPDHYPLGAEVTFDAYCKSCDADLDVTEYYIED